MRALQLPCARIAAAATSLLIVTCVLSPAVRAGEGGTSHLLPGATATLSDLPGVAEAWFVKPMYLNYTGDVSVTIPTAAGLASNADAEADTFVLAMGRTFDTTLLGGAHYTFAIAQPYTSLDISADIATPLGTLRKESEVSGLGDLTVIPVMLAWKSGDWQFNSMTAVYAPTGDYEKGRLGNPGLNYWTFDQTVGAVYANKQTGLNAMAHVGLGVNTENEDTEYESGSMLHLEAAVQQLLPVGRGVVSLGAEGFWFEQVTGDEGDGATLGDFEGRTAGAGPVLGYILPMGERTLLLEAKWLAEIETKRRLEGDYIWLKLVYKL